MAWSGSNKCMPANPMTTYTGCVCADTSAFAHRRPHIELMPGLRIFATRPLHIGKDHGRPAKYVVAQFDAIVYGDIVLNLTEVSNSYPGCNKDILPHGAILPNGGVLTDVAKMPDLCSLADLHICVYTCTRMNKKCVVCGILHEQAPFLISGKNTPFFPILPDSSRHLFPNIIARRPFLVNLSPWN